MRPRVQTCDKADTKHWHTYREGWVTSGESWEEVIMGEELTGSGIGSGWKIEAKIDMVGGERLGSDMKSVVV